MKINHNWLDPETGKLDEKRIPDDVLNRLALKKESMILFHDTIDLLEELIGESPGIAKLLYALRDFDRTIEKDSFSDPDFSNFGEAAATLKVLWQKSKKAAMNNYRKWATVRLSKSLARGGVSFEETTNDER